MIDAAFNIIGDDGTDDNVDIMKLKKHIFHRRQKKKL